MTYQTKTFIYSYQALHNTGNIVVMIGMPTWVVCV